MAGFSIFQALVRLVVCLGHYEKEIGDLGKNYLGDPPQTSYFGKLNVAYELTLRPKWVGHCRPGRSMTLAGALHHACTTQVG